MTARSDDYVTRAPWTPVPTAGLVLSFAFAALIVYFTFFGGGWVPLVDDANVAVHEAGHPLLGVVNAQWSVYGGTLAQLAFPALCVFEFWRRCWTLSCALCGVWLGQCLFNVAIYAADAQAMQLPLLSFGPHPLHDWNRILSRWGVLQYDAAIASALRGVGFIVIAAALWFLYYQWWQERPVEK